MFLHPETSAMSVSELASNHNCGSCLDWSREGRGTVVGWSGSRQDRHVDGRGIDGLCVDAMASTSAALMGRHVDGRYVDVMDLS